MDVIIIPPENWFAPRHIIRGPLYLRFTRDAVPFVYDETEAFEIGKARF